MNELLTLADQSGLANLTWQAPVMWAIGIVFIYLGIKRDIEPLLLVPIGFSVLMVNVRSSSM